MRTPEELEDLKNATASLERMQKFDVDTLVRESELGQKMNFREVVPAASRLIELYKRLSIIALDDFPRDILRQVKVIADQDFNRLAEATSFTLEQPNPQEARRKLIDTISAAYGPVFTHLHHLIAYSLHRSADFQRLEQDARGTLQSIKDKADAVSAGLKKQLEDATRIVAEVRKIAAETGVTQQATYFKEEADAHEYSANVWKKRTFQFASALGGYAVIALFLAKIPFFKPTDVYESIHFGIGKLLIFAVLSFLLYLAARNFLSHKHNSIVNRHRQNALLTYQALVDAAKTAEKSQVVLTHASACIFAPQPTGYSPHQNPDGMKATSVVEMFSNPIGAGEK